MESKIAIPKHILSKSTFMYGCQCPKRLWLHKYQPNVRDEMDEEQANIFQRGTDVGMLARQLYPCGIDASPASPYKYQQSVTDTNRYIREGHTVIYEAAFQHEGILCAVDILVNKKGKWYAYEVKSSTKVKDAFVQDAAFQYNVITRSGLPLENFYIVHLNSSYVRSGELEIKKLFTAVSVKKQVIDMQQFLKEKIAALTAVVLLKQAPEQETGTHCNKPYQCDFYNFCHKDMPDEDPEEEYINQEYIQEFIRQLKYPLYYLDFETWMTAVPECDGHWSYRQIPFQFSLHVQQNAGGELDNLYYLADGTHSSNFEFVESLLKTIGIKGTILVYNQAFENMILNNLKDEFPQWATRINKIQKRIVDLMSPFRKNYRLPEMQWSYSIKYVLPALVPELRYDDLTITNGTDASAVFYNLQHETDEIKKQTLRGALLEYCKLDTLAMVKIVEKLKTISL